MTKTNKMVLTRPSSEDVWLKRIYSSCSLRRLLKRKTKDVLKTSWGRLYQDKCLQGWRGNWQTKLLIMRQKLKHTNLHQKCNLSKRGIKVEKCLTRVFTSWTKTSDSVSDKNKIQLKKKRIFFHKNKHLSEKFTKKR